MDVRTYVARVGLGLGMAVLGGAASLGMPEATAGGDIGLPPGDPPGGEITLGAQVGTLGGGVSVGKAGGAGWSVDLATPAGPGESTPSVSIGYAGGGYGGVGVGFSLEVGGSINRCHKTYGEDGENRPLTWTIEDPICYAGSRLVVYSGEHGKSGAEYRPKGSPLTRIVQHGQSTEKDSGFTVYTPGGSVTEYGTLENPAHGEEGVGATLRAKFDGKEVPLSWGIKRVEDVAGNVRVYDYAGEEAEGDRVLTPADPRLVAIRYGANAQAEAEHSRAVKFHYMNVQEWLTLETQLPNATNATLSWGYAGGMSYRRRMMLTKVVMEVGGAQARDYRLNYEVVPTWVDGINQGADRLRLKELKECGLVAQQQIACFPPTTFEWSAGPSGFEPAPSWGFDSVPFYPLPKASELETAKYTRAAIQLQGDFNGDGVGDLLVSPERVNEPVDLKPSGWGVWELWRMNESTANPAKTNMPSWNTFGDKGYWVSQAGKQEVEGQLSLQFHPEPITIGNTRDPNAVPSAWSVNYDGDTRTDVLVGDAIDDLDGLLMDAPWALGQATTWTRGVNSEASDDCTLIPQDSQGWQDCAESRTWSEADYKGHPGVMKGFTVWRLKPGTDVTFEKTSLNYPEGNAVLWATTADVDGNGLDDLVFCRSDVDYAAEAGKPQPMYYRDEEPSKNWLKGQIRYALNVAGSGIDLSNGGIATNRGCHFKDALYVMGLHGDGRDSVLQYRHLSWNEAPKTEDIAIVVPPGVVDDPYPEDPEKAELKYYLPKVHEKVLAEQLLGTASYDALTWSKADGLQVEPTDLPLDGFMRWQSAGNHTQRYSTYQPAADTNIDGGMQDLNPATTYNYGRMTDWGDPRQRLMTGTNLGQARFMDVNGDGLSDALMVEMEQCYYKQVPPTEEDLPPHQSRTCSAQDAVEFGLSLFEQTYEKLRVQVYLNRGDGTFDKGEAIRLWDTDITVAEQKLLAGITPILGKAEQDAFNKAWSKATHASRGWRMEFGSSQAMDPNANGLADLFFVRADFTPDGGSFGQQMSGKYELTPKYLRVTSGGEFDSIDEAGLDLNKLAPAGGWPSFISDGTQWKGELDQIGEVDRYEAHEKGIGMRYVLTDFNRDGIADVLVYNHVLGQWQFAKGISPGIDNPINGTKAKGTAAPNLLTAVVDGLKSRVEIDYAPQWTLPATGTQWTEADSLLPYPLVRRPSSAAAVSAVRSDTGSDNGNQPDYTTVRYRYGKATVDGMRGATLGIDKRETRSTEVTSSGTVFTSRMERYDTNAKYDATLNAYPLAGTLMSETTRVTHYGTSEPNYFTHSGYAYSAKAGVAKGTWRRQTDASTSTTFEIPNGQPGPQEVYECLIDAFDGAAECVLGNGPDFQPTSTGQTLTVYDDYGYPLVSQVKAGGATTITTVPEYLHQDTLLFGNYALGMAKETWVGNQPRPDAEFSVHTTAFVYYPDGRLREKIIEPTQPTYRQSEVIIYDSFGNVKKANQHAEGAEDSWVINDYSASGVYLEKATNALGHTITTTWHEGCGVPLQQTNVLKQTKVNHYDSFCRPTGSQSFYGNLSMGPRSTIAYAEFQPDVEEPYKDVELKVTTSVQGGASSYQVTDRTGKAYYREGQGFGMKVYSQSVYDRLGREVLTSPSTQVGKDPEGWSEVTLDGKGRTRTLTHPDGTTQVTNYRRYDSAQDGVVTFQGAPIACEGCTVAEVTNELHHTGKSVSNALGQVVKVIPPKEEEADAPDTSMCYSYGAFGVLTDARPCVAHERKGPTTFKADLYGRLIASEDGQRGQRETHYSALGQVDYAVDAKGTKTKFIYDVLGRTVERIEDWQGPNEKSATWSYDPELGILKEARNAEGTVIERPTLDGYRRPNGGETVVHGRSYWSKQTYDSRGRPQESSYPSLDPQHPVLTTTHYNTLDQVIYTSYGDGILWKPLTADALGHITKQTYGNGLFARTQYEPKTGRLKEATVYREKQAEPDLFWEEPLQIYQYSWYDNGSLRMRIQKGLTQTQNDQAEQFYYTPRGELKGWSTIGANNALQNSYLRTDGFGNITQGPPGEYSYEKEHLKFVKGDDNLIVYEYDKNGSVKQRTEKTGTTNLIYNALNKVESIEDSQGTLRITYSADGVKVHTQNEKTGEETTYLGNYQETRGGSLGSQVVSRYNLGPAQLVRTWTAPLLPMTYTDEPLTYQTPADHLGSLTLITTATGDVKEERSYGTWGQLRNAKNWLEPQAPKQDPKALNLGYTGHEYKTFGGNGGTGGLIDMKARYYDPLTYRMMQADSVIPNIAQPLALNAYTYAYNTPTAFTDPQGNAPAPPASEGTGTPQDEAERGEAEARAAAAERSVSDLAAHESSMAYQPAIGEMGLDVQLAWGFAQTVRGLAYAVSFGYSEGLGDKLFPFGLMGGRQGQLKSWEEERKREYAREKQSYNTCMSMGICSGAPFKTFDEWVVWRSQSREYQIKVMSRNMQDGVMEAAGTHSSIFGGGWFMGLGYGVAKALGIKPSAAPGPAKPSTAPAAAPNRNIGFRVIVNPNARGPAVRRPAGTNIRGDSRPSGVFGPRAGSPGAAGDGVASNLAPLAAAEFGEAQVYRTSVGWEIWAQREGFPATLVGIVTSVDDGTAQVTLSQPFRYAGPRNARWMTDSLEMVEEVWVQRHSISDGVYVPNGSGPSGSPMPPLPPIDDLPPLPSTFDDF